MYIFLLYLVNFLLLMDKFLDEVKVLVFNLGSDGDFFCIIYRNYYGLVWVYKLFVKSRMII